MADFTKSFALVAQLDRGSIENDVDTMAKNLAKAIESAFVGIGEQISISILSGVRQGLLGSVEMIGQSRLGGGNIPTTQSILQSQATTASTALPRGVLTDQYGSPINPGLQPEPIIPPGAAPPPTAPTSPQQEPQRHWYDEETQGGTPKTTRTPKTEGGFLEYDKAFATKIAGMAGVLGEGIGLIGEMPGIRRNAAASRAEVENLGGRAMMRGDFESAILQQQMGGNEAIRDQATTEETTKLVGNVLKSGAIATIVGAIAAAPFTGGLSLTAALAAGGGMAAFSAIRGTSGLDTAVETNTNARIEAERKRQAEFLTMTQRGRETGIAAYQTAQGIGGPEFAPMISGMGMPQIGGMDIRQFSAQQGLSPEQFTQTMTGFSGLGGIYPGGPQLAQEPELLGRALTQVGQGFTQMPQVAQGMVQGGMSPVEAVRAAADMFEEAVAAGLDKARAGEALLRMSQRAEQMGFGGGAAAEIQTQQSLGLAQQMFPGQDISPAQQSIAEKMQQFGQQGATRGFDLMSNLRGTRGAERKFGVKAGNAELETYLSRQNVTAEGIRAMEGLTDERGKPMFPGLSKVSGKEEEFAADVMKERAQERIRTREAYQGKEAARAGIVTSLVGENAPIEQVAATIRGEQAMRREGTMTPGVPVGTGPGGIRMPSPDQLSAQQQMKQAAIQTAATDAAVVSQGLNTLAQQLPALNTAFTNLLNKIQQISPAVGAPHSSAAPARSTPFLGMPFGTGGPSRGEIFDVTKGMVPEGS